MAACTSCGVDVTGKNLCPECGTPVPSPATQVATAQPASSSTCPRCNGEVKPGAAFCMNCGSSLSAQAQPAVQTAASVASMAPAVSQPLTRPCPSCHTEIPVGTTFCTNCGQNMNASAPATAGYCP